MLRIRGLTGLLIATGLYLIMAGCASPPGSNSTGETQISFTVPFSSIEGMNATVEISGIGTLPMTFNADGTATIIVPDISAGWHNFTATYYSTDGLILAQASTGTYIIAGQLNTITFVAQDMNQNFDEDGDGWVNLAEMLMGTNPLLAASYPLGEDPRFTITAIGGVMASNSSTLYYAGGAFEGGESSGSAYQLQRGFQIYP